MIRLKGFDELEQYLNGLIARLSPVQQRKLLREIGRYFLKKNRQRIRAQKNTDGSRYQARKNKKIRRKMLTGFARHMKSKVTTSSVQVGIFGSAANLAEIHHAGETEHGIRYPSRELVGWDDDDIQAIEDMIATLSNKAS